MSNSETLRRRADDLLKQAAAATNMSERSRLITEASHWHMKASEASNDDTAATDEGANASPNRSAGGHAF